MNKGCKIALIGCGVLVAIGVIASVAVGGWGAKHAKQFVEGAAATAAQIVDYTVPSGYKEMGTSIGKMQVVTVMPTSGHGMQFVLMQIPSAAGSTEAQRKGMEDAMRKQVASGSSGMTKAVEKAVTIRGEALTMTISEGAVGAAVTRRGFVAFQGKGGPAMLTVTAAKDQWDDAVLDSFLGSME